LGYGKEGRKEVVNMGHTTVEKKGMKVHKDGG